MSRPSIWVLCPMELEARAARTAVAQLRGANASARIIVKPIGIGAVHLPAIESYVRCVVLAGFAGALDPALKIGDVVMDASQLATKLEAGGSVPGTFATSRELVTTPADRAKMFAATHARAVEMEGDVVRAAIAGSCALLHLRAISDTADHTLDPAVLKWVDTLGRPKPLKIAGAVLRKPGMIPELLRLQKATKLAFDALVRELAAVLPSVVEAFCREA